MEHTSRYPRNRLKRNTACQRCNQRKTKCDAVRPMCGSCFRHNRHLHRSSSGTGAPITCFYDDPPGEEHEGSNEPEQSVSLESSVSAPSSGPREADWPQGLPPRPLLDHLIGIYFASVPSVNHLIHEARFRSRLSNAPSHPSFPHLALLHAICAVGSRFTAAVQVETVEENVQRRARFLEGKKHPPSNPSTDAGPTCFAYRHARLASIAMDIGQAFGRGLLEMCQAQVILVTNYLYTAHHHRSFLMAGQASRMGQFLGLLSEPDANRRASRWSSILPHPVDDTEREEYRRLACSLVLTDTAVSLCGFWPMALIPEELALKMPAPFTNFQASNIIPENPQSIRVLNLFDDHPVQDSFVMHIKAMMLLRLVVDLRRKSELANISGGEVTISDDPIFAFLKRACRDFADKLPPGLNNPVTPVPGSPKGLDSDVIVGLGEGSPDEAQSAHIVPHIAMIVHCEPYARIGDPRCHETRAVLAAAHCVSAIIQKLLSRDVDWKISVSPLGAHWLHIASRSLLQEYRHALRTADLSGVTTISSSLDTIKNGLTKMANHNAVAYLVLKHNQSTLDEMNREVFAGPSVAFDPSLLQQTQPGSSSGAHEEFRWDEYLLWPMNFDQQNGFSGPTPG